jgi:hypothetical protein
MPASQPSHAHGADARVIAQYSFVLPTAIYMPASARLKYLEEEVDGERVFVRLASLDDPDISVALVSPPDASDALETLINGEATKRARLAVVEFRRNTEFDRSRAGAAWDPPVEVARAAVNQVLARLRAYGRAPFLSLVTDLGQSHWVAYLDDSRAPLPTNPLMSRRKVMAAGQIGGLISVTPEAWAELQTVLPSQVTTWDTLLLDAYQVLPEIGPSLVLALAAVETAATAACANRASAQVPAALWTFFADDLRVGDLLGKVLAGLGGTALSAADAQLWERFLALRTGRNSFCHRGDPVDHQGVHITAPGAASLVVAADEILQWLETYLPSHQHRPRSTIAIQTTTTYPLLRVADAPPGAATDSTSSEPIDPPA